MELSLSEAVEKAAKIVSLYRNEFSDLSNDIAIRKLIYSCKPPEAKEISKTIVRFYDIKYKLNSVDDYSKTEYQAFYHFILAVQNELRRTNALGKKKIKFATGKKSYEKFLDFIDGWNAELPKLNDVFKDRLGIVLHLELYEKPLLELFKFKDEPSVVPKEDNPLLGVGLLLVKKDSTAKVVIVYPDERKLMLKGSFKIIGIKNQFLKATFHSKKVESGELEITLDISQKLSGPRYFNTIIGHYIDYSNPLKLTYAREHDFLEFESDAEDNEQTPINLLPFMWYRKPKVQNALYSLYESERKE